MSDNNTNDATPTPDYYISGRKYEPRKVMLTVDEAIDLWKAKDFINFESLIFLGRKHNERQ